MEPRRPRAASAASSCGGPPPSRHTPPRRRSRRGRSGGCRRPRAWSLPSAYSSATPVPICSCAHPIAERRRRFRPIVVTRLWPTRRVLADERRQGRRLRSRHQHQLEPERSPGPSPSATTASPRRSAVPSAMIARRSTDFSASITLWVTRKTALPHSPRRRDLVPEQPPPQRVDVVRGLVQDHDPARPYRHHREPHQPLDPAREFRADGVAPLAEIERLDQLVGPPIDGGAVTLP